MSRILVLGGGPAGYVAAGRAAQLGARVTLVEARELGGTCLNRGCIPTKAMVAGAARLSAVKEASEFGVRATGVSLDFAALMARKDAVTEQLRASVAHLMQARKVEVVTGRARLAGLGRLVLSPGPTPAGAAADGGVSGDDVILEGDAVILASGSEPARPTIFDWHDPRVMTSDELLAIDHVPESLVVVGGGVIGCEFAGIFSRLGTRVTVVEMLGHLLPDEDKRVAQTLQQAFRKAGIEVIVNTPVEALETSAAGPTLHLAGGREVAAARVLVAVGRRAVSADLGYAEAGVTLDDRGFVVTDETLRTSLPGVFAAGDLAGPPLLAHWACHQGAIAAENAVTGARLGCGGHVVPNCVFSTPEVASCGLTEDRAAAQGREVQVTGVRFGGNSKATIEGEPDGFVRLVCEPHGGRVLGASLVGPHVTELVQELALAVQAGLSLSDVAATIHAHPTLSEAVGEAALNGLGRRIHSL